ncbi:RNA polymerase sigma factor [Actinokineospora soli]|uniref:RNA polymerase sigma factor n=1 Tax=Actinokineospora soli TaxID=1048753 RepID=A0ABW2TJJ3_9PSEU
MRDDPTVVALVERARAGDSAAWDGIVDRYAPLVWAVCGRFRLSRADAEDVGAAVWLRLVERLDGLRDPAALPGWLLTTTRNECLLLLRSRERQVPVADDFPEEPGADAEDWVLALERASALRAGFAALSERCRRLLGMLFADPPAHYRVISDELGMKVGAIGPTRARCLDRLRATPAVAGLMPETSDAP